MAAIRHRLSDLSTEKTLPNVENCKKNIGSVFCTWK